LERFNFYLFLVHRSISGKNIAAIYKIYVCIYNGAKINTQKAVVQPEITQKNSEVTGAIFFVRARYFAGKYHFRNEVGFVRFIFVLQNNSNQVLFEKATIIIKLFFKTEVKRILVSLFCSSHKEFFYSMESKLICKDHFNQLLSCRPVWAVVES
jgi:hypothetical protein